MALVSSQEVALTITASAEDGGSVRKLSEQLAAAADNAGTAAPSLRALAAEVAAIESAQGAVQALIALKRETGELGKQMDAAQSQVDGLANQLDEARAAAIATGQAQADAAARLAVARGRYDELRTAVAGARDELRQAKDRVREAGAATGEYAAQVTAARERLAGLRSELGAARVSVTDLSREHKAASAATREAAVAERGLSKEYDQTIASAKRLSTELGTKRAALDATRQSLQGAGVNTRELATEHRRLAADMEAVQARASRLTTAYAGVAASSTKAGQQAEAGFRTAGGAAELLGTRLTAVAGAIGGLFAVNQLAGWGKALSQVADSAASLEARTRLAVGANGDLQAALDDVRASANAAGSDINSVGELYGRIASSTADLGYSQERVAGLTDAINKSFVVSGSSGSAASGAITQLAQAFAAGALRGDEFNSVNEAAPRLMDALAAGLGVARGELRKMAEQGQLTSEVVLGALESQRDAIERDFATLPETVGKATQRMANEWQVFIGNLDETTGASETVANGLNLIANNLDNISSVAATAGELVVSALAVKAAAALRGYITLTAASTAATTAKAAALTGLAAAGNAAAAAMLTLGRALPGLAVAGAVGGVAFLVTKFFEAKSAAEDAEEAVAKLLADPPPNATADQIRLIATEAELARFRLAEVEKTFLDLRQKGQDAATALSNIAKASNIDSSEGIGKLLAHLDLLREGAQATGQQIQAALADRLKKLSSDDMQAFGIQAEMAFSRGVISAQQLGIALDAQVRAALQRLGVDADVALNGMSAKFSEAIGSVELLAGQYDRMSASGVNAAGALQQGLDGALKRASSPVELEALVTLIERMGREGKLSGEQVEAALDKARQKADELTPGINSVAEALKRLGIQSDADLKKTAEGFKQAYNAVVQMGGSVREQREAFQRYAEAAIKANGGVANATLMAKAAQHELRIEVDGTGESIVAAMSEGAAAIAKLSNQAEEAAAKVGLIKRQADGLKGVWDENGNLIPDGAARTYGGGRAGGGVQSYTERGAYERAKSEGLDAATALRLAREFANTNRLREFQEAIDAAVLTAARKAAGTAAADTARREPLSAPAERIEIHRVDIKLGNRNTSINTSSAADAAALTGILRELGEAAARS